MTKTMPGQRKGFFGQLFEIFSGDQKRLYETENFIDENSGIWEKFLLAFGGEEGQEAS